MGKISSLSKSIAILASVVMLVISSLVFSSPAEAKNYKVTMGAGGLQYNPKKVTVQPGDTVTFKNGMLPPHNVMFDPRKSPNAKLSKALSHKKFAMKPGESFDVNIPDNATSGDYEFFCLPHRGAGMVGHMIVE
ncbi:MAG: plastocyanin [Trichodesmium sp. St19_bin1]|nr:plastocyanin [Trichodesmium sp. St19_bin1]